MKQYSLLKPSLIFTFRLFSSCIYMYAREAFRSFAYLSHEGLRVLLLLFWHGDLHVACMQGLFQVSQMERKD